MIYYVYLNGREIYTGSSPPTTMTLEQGENNVTVVAVDSLGVRSVAEFTSYSSLQYLPFLIVLILVIAIVVAVILRRGR
ncbi:hypothetical protein IC007_0367 [Sulfuracidifex tepidarius]|uniref:Uncharacterized protein n=1 Tax=Sulfuracidifex tepidarius TaxID=1294262 RepID=A0A510E071_9CREN|nr:hypothetical protein IC007_0367 [Sulfuracidifex tepidarius]